MIPYKLFLKMTDLAATNVSDPENYSEEKALVDFQESIGWPWKANQQQINDWNDMATGWYEKGEAANGNL